MAQSLSVSGVEYIPALTAGKRFGYTREYILMLAREGKITAQKINNRWFIDPTSLEQFCANTKETQKVRGAMIRKQRQAELRAYEETVRPVQQRAAIFETVAILIVGLAIGTMGYVGTPSRLAATAESAEHNVLERFAIAFYTFISPLETKTVEVAETPVAPAAEGAPTMAVAPVAPPMAANAVTAESAARAASALPAPSLIVAPAAEFSKDQAAQVAESFSDPVTVTVDPEQPNTGIIVPHFRSGDGEAYRYLMVPVERTTAAMEATSSNEVTEIGA